MRGYLIYPLSYRNLLEMAILEEKYYGDLRCRTQHRIIKYLNNIVEQDLRFIKRKTNQILGLKSHKTAKSTVSGMKLLLNS